MIQLPPIARLLGLAILRVALPAGLSACGGNSFLGAVLRLPSHEPEQVASQHFVPPSAYEAYVRGEVLLAAGDAAGAVRELSAAAAYADDDVYVLTRLALAQDRAGDREAARSTLALAERHAPCHASMWEVRGELFVAHGELDAARGSYERGLACAPDSIDARLRLSALLQRMDRHAEALALLPRPDDRQSESARLAVARALSGASAAELAFTFDAWLGQGPVDSQTLVRGVERALALGAPRLAARLLDHVRVDVGLALRGRVLAALGDREGLRELLARTPLLDDSLTTAELALAAGDLERAAAEATRATLDAPSDRAFAVRARAEAERGDVHAAIEAAQAVEKPELRRALERELLAAFGSPALGAELLPVAAPAP